MNSDKFYILCEFINENEVDRMDEEVTTPVRVGFSEWLKFEEGKPRKSIESLIADKDEVELKWPTNYDVKCKEAMSKHQDIEWTIAVAVIIAQENEWEKIRECEKCMIKYNKPYMDRKMMKEAARTAPTKKKSDANKKEAGKVTTIKKRKRSSQDSVLRAEKCEDKKILETRESSDGEAQDPVSPTIESKPKGATKNLSPPPVLDSNESSDTDDVDTLHKRVEQMDNLKAQNRWIKKELNALRATKVFAETDFPGLKKELKSIKDEVKDIKSVMKSQVKSLIKDELKQLKDEIRILIDKCKNCTCSAKKAEKSNSLSSSGVKKVCSNNSSKTLLPNSANECLSQTNTVKIIEKESVSRMVKAHISSLTPDRADICTKEASLINKPSFKNHSDWANEAGPSTSTQQSGTSLVHSFSMDISESSLLKEEIMSSGLAEEKKITLANASEIMTIDAKADATVISILQEDDIPVTVNLGNANNSTLLDQTVPVPVITVSKSKSMSNTKEPSKPEIDPKEDTPVTVNLDNTNNGTLPDQTVPVPVITVSKSKSKSKSKSNKKEPSRAQPEIDPKAIFKFGGATLTGEEVSRCKHNGKISSLAVDLFSALFTPKEMALNNLTGRIPNGHVQLFPKGKLDEAQIAGIIDYMAEFLKKEMPEKADVDKEVKTAICNKLSNFGKCAEAKTFVQEEFERRQREANSTPAAKPDE